MASDRPLTADYVAALRSKFPEAVLRIHDDLLEERVQFEDDWQDREQANAAMQPITDCIARLQKHYQTAKSLGGTAVEMGRVIEQAIGAIDPARPGCVVPEAFDVAGPWLGRRAARVAYLSLILATAARGYVMEERQRLTTSVRLSARQLSDLAPLGTGAMLCDIAYLENEKFSEPGRKLSATDRERLIEHPDRGADLLPEHLPGGAKSIVRAHHENCDGSGFPRSVGADRLHIFTRVVRICDCFVSGTFGDLETQPIGAARTLFNMLNSPAREHFDPVLLDHFLKVVHPFPVGAKIQLQSGRTAVVVSYNREHALRPRVVIIDNHLGERLEAQYIDEPQPLSSTEQLLPARYGEQDLAFLATAALPEISQRSSRRVA